MANVPSITAKAGKDFLLKVSDGSSPTAYNTISGMRATQLSFNGNPVDITNKGSAGWQELLPDGGIASMQLSASGIFDSKATQSVYLRQLQQAAFQRTLVECQIISGHGDKFMGLFCVGNFTREGPHDNAETYSFQLSSSGPVVYSLS